MLYVSYGMRDEKEALKKPLCSDRSVKQSLHEVYSKGVNGRKHHRLTRSRRRGRTWAAPSPQ
jgi:hypothetical protein